MDLNFYSDLPDNAAEHVDQDFLETQSYNGYPGNKFPGGSDNYLTITGASHPFLSAEQTFHTPSLGDEVFEIPPISLDPDSALNVGDVVSHFGELSESTGGPPGAGNLARNAVVGGNDPSFASTYVNPSTQGLEHLSLGVMSQSGGGALLSSTLGVELGHSISSHFSSSSPMTIDVPLGDMNHALLGHNQLATIDQAELNAHLGLGLGGGTIMSRSKSPDQPMSATPSPAGSLQDEDMDDFRSVLVDSPMSLSISPAVLSHMSTQPGSSFMPSSTVSPVVVRRGGGKPAMLAATVGTGAAGGKKGRKKKDPNEPQKPVSAYALFFRDTQAAIKGQNPNATFGEVSKIVASMWDSLGEEQKQVYKRKTEAAKKDYLKALAAYRANQLSQPTEVMDTAPSPPPPMPDPVPVVRPARLPQPIPDQNTITNICASNIILDVPQVTTRSRTGANKPLVLGPPTTATPSLTQTSIQSPSPTITKIIISKQMLQAGAQIHQIPTSMVTVLPAGLRALQPAAVSSLSSRQPPPLQQMQHAPPPPRLQQMVHSPAPPPLQAKPRGGAGQVLPVSVTTTPPPPLQIKIVPASLQGNTGVVVSTAATANSVGTSHSTTGPTSVYSTPTVDVQVVKSSDATDEETVTEEFTPGEVEMELNVSPGLINTTPASLSMCVRAGCTNPAVESKDWDREYCSNECVATHCRDIFMAWCSIRGQNTAAVK